MGSSEGCVRIDRFDNGFTVEIKDPAIVKYNALPYDEKKSRPYREPWKSYVFTTADEVIVFLKANLKKAIADRKEKDDFGTAFDIASADDEEE